jgi:hypothetical protein
MVGNVERYERASDFEAKVFSKSGNKRTQCEYLKEYLEMFGSITPLEALSAFGCFRLSARVSDLRAEGVNIRTTIHKGEKNYAIYELEEEDGNEEIQSRTEEQEV